MMRLLSAQAQRISAYMGVLPWLIKRLIAGAGLILIMNAPATQVGAAPAASPVPAVKIVALGDSLTAGYLLPPNEAFPAQLSAALNKRGINAEVANAGVSGDTTADGLQRFEWSVGQDTEAVILELGANDGLRGLDPALARKNLDAILAKLKARNIEVLVAGITAPQNWGQDYARTFNAMFAELSEKYGALLYPFFLDGVALKPELNQSDGLHPTGKGVAVIVERILPSVEALIDRVVAHRTATAKN